VPILNAITASALSPLLQTGPIADDLATLPGLKGGTPGAILEELANQPGLQRPGAAADLIRKLLGPGPIATPTEPPVFGRPVNEGPVVLHPADPWPYDPPVFGRPV
jgi:hypothetical protein